MAGAGQRTSLVDAKFPKVTADDAVDWSVKLTVRGARPLSGEPLKSASGGGLGLSTWM